MKDISNIRKEYDDIINQLSNPELVSDWEKFEELSKRKKSLEKIIEKQKEIEEIENKIEENKVILNSGEDEELTTLAETETAQLQEKEKFLKKELKKLLESDGDSSSEPHSAIVEIRAGTGGKEAALFAEDLFRMYSR